MKIKQVISEKQAEFTELCEKHYAKSIYAFGSSVNENFQEASSDIDFNLSSIIKIGLTASLLRGQTA